MPRSGLETAWAVIPAACSCSTTSFQLELSANAPWTRATVRRELTVLASVMRFLLGGDDGRLGCALPARVWPEAAAGCVSTGVSRQRQARRPAWRPGWGAEQGRDVHRSSGSPVNEASGCPASTM